MGLGRKGREEARLQVDVERLLWKGRRIERNSDADGGEWAGINGIDLRGCQFKVVVWI